MSSNSSHPAAGARPVVIQNLSFNRSNTWDFANQCNARQTAFHFTLGKEIDRSSIAPFELDDGNYDLDAWVSENSALLDSHRPLIIVTSAGYGDPDFQGDPDGHYFVDLNVEVDGLPQAICIISVKPWKDRFPKDDKATSYLLLMATTWLLGTDENSGIENPFHEETHGCLFDYCDHLDDVLRVLEKSHLPSAPFCLRCWISIDKALGAGTFSANTLAAALAIYWGAAGMESAFFAVPYSDDHAEISEVIERTLGKRYQKVLRADEFRFIKDLPTRMRVLIRCVDTLVAEVSSGNANVMFELGFADAIHKDSLLLSSVKPLPFDIGHRHCIFYDDLDDLEAKLTEELGGG